MSSSGHRMPFLVLTGRPVRLPLRPGCVKYCHSLRSSSRPHRRRQQLPRCSSRFRSSPSATRQLYAKPPSNRIHRTSPLPSSPATSHQGTLPTRDWSLCQSAPELRCRFRHRRVPGRSRYPTRSLSYTFRHAQSCLRSISKEGPGDAAGQDQQDEGGDRSTAGALAALDHRGLP